MKLRLKHNYILYVLQQCFLTTAQYKNKDKIPIFGPLQIKENF